MRAEPVKSADEVDCFAALAMTDWSSVRRSLILLAITSVIEVFLMRTSLAEMVPAIEAFWAVRVPEMEALPSMATVSVISESGVITAVLKVLVLVVSAIRF